MAEEVWVSVIGDGVIDDGDVLGVEVERLKIAIYYVNGEYFATSDLCTHQAGRLSEGYFDGKSIECPVHQGCFDICTGKALGSPVVRDIKVYKTRVMDGKVQIQITTRK